MMIIENVHGPVHQYQLVRRIFKRDVYTTAAYFVDGLLIDTGFKHIANRFFQTLRLQPIEQIAHTHAHEDHIGANFLFQKYMGIKAHAHEMAVDRIVHPPDRLRMYRRVVWGLPKSAETVPITEQLLTNKYAFQVLKLPGHSDDHIGFYEPDEGWLFGGDLFLSVKVKVLKYDENIHDWIDSLKKVVDLPMSCYFCSSGKIINHPGRLLKLKLEYYEDVKQKVLQLYYHGWKLREIRDQVLGKEPALTYLSQGEFSKLNLVKALACP